MITNINRIEVEEVSKDENDVIKTIVINIYIT